MRSKFRMLTIMVTTIVMIFVFAGCGNSAKSVKGETFDGGNIEVFVPEGWKAFHGADVFTVKKHRPVIRTQQIAEQADQCGLTRPIGAEQSDDAMRYFKIDMVYSSFRAEFFCQIS